MYRGLLVETYNLFIMNKLNILLSKNHFRIVVIIICIFSILVYLLDRNIIPSFLKLFIFGSLLLLSFFFVPYQLTVSNDMSNKISEIVSKILLGISCAYIALLTVAISEKILIAGSIIIICNGVFSIFMLLYKNEKSREIFISHTLLVFFLVGLTKMLG